MTSFGMLMNSPDSEFQRIRLQKRANILRYAPSELPGLADFPVLISPDGVSQSNLLNNL
jgi:hypothetical protein